MCQLPYPDLFFRVVLGGVLFKVYIVGEAIKVVRRYSLPDVSKRELKKNAGVYRFPRVSCAAASADEADLDPHIAGRWTLNIGNFERTCVLSVCWLSKNHLITAELPPRPLLERLAKELRQRLVVLLSIL